MTRGCTFPCPCSGRKPGGGGGIPIFRFGVGGRRPPSLRSMNPASGAMMGAKEYYTGCASLCGCWATSACLGLI